jgi:hypothetical protein
MEQIGVTATNPENCQVSAQCGDQVVEVSCSLDGSSCACTSDVGTRTVPGHSTCNPDEGPALLKLCGFAG